MPDRRRKSLDTLSTGQVAKICDVAPRTAATWIDKGILKAWRVPNSNQRRIELADLRHFMIAHGLPLTMLPHAMGGGRTRVVIVGGAPEWARTLGADCDVRRAQSAYDALMAVMEFRADAVIISAEVGTIVAVELAAMILERTREWILSPVLIAVVGDDANTTPPGFRSHVREMEVQTQLKHTLTTLQTVQRT